MIDPTNGPGRGAAGAGLRDRLNTLDRDELVDLLLRAADRDPALERRLSLAAGRTDPDLSALRASVHATFASRDYLDYWPAIRFAQAAGDAVDALADLVRDGRSADALPLVQDAIRLLLAAVGRADDSAGSLNELMGRLLRIHAGSCASAQADPVVLARWLVDFQLGGQDWFTVDIGDYAEALGASGLAVYRAATDAQWHARPADFDVRHAREGLARWDRDVAALVEVVGGDLGYAAQYGRLARALQDIGEPAAAVQWAERGLKEHPDDPPGAGLRDFLVEAYLSRDGGADAVRLRRDGMAARPVLHSYTLLRNAAQQAGCWEAEQRKALRVLAQRNPGDHVRALLAESDVDGAWRSAHATTGISGPVWDELARRRAVTHPGDVVEVMRRRIYEMLSGTGRDVYREAVRRLHQLREVCVRCGRMAEFEAWVRDLAERNRRRPTFLAELHDSGLAHYPSPP